MYKEMSIGQEQQVPVAVWCAPQEGSHGTENTTRQCNSLTQLMHVHDVGLVNNPFHLMHYMH